MSSEGQGGEIWEPSNHAMLLWISRKHG